MEVRNVRVADATAIADIYNHYVAETTVSFELQPVMAEEMGERIVAISALTSKALVGSSPIFCNSAA